MLRHEKYQEEIVDVLIIIRVNFDCLTLSPFENCDYLTRHLKCLKLVIIALWQLEIVYIFV